MDFIEILYLKKFVRRDVVHSKIAVLDLFLVPWVRSDLKLGTGSVANRD